MKALFPALGAALALLFIAAFGPSSEQAPAGAAEKIAAAIPAEAYAKPAAPRKMLVFSRTNGFRHDSIPTGKLALTEMGKRTGAFQTVVSDDLANFEADRLAEFDAVCFLNTTMEVFAPSKAEAAKMNEAALAEAKKREERLKANLMEYVKGGKGFVGIHAATDTFYEWPEYLRMVNGCFDGHPWHANFQVSIKVEPGQEKHPLVAMMDGRNLEFKEEIYQFRDPYDSAAVHMLMRLDTEKTDMTPPGVNRKDNDFGVSWARHWGKGRVFYTSIGHNHEMYWHPKVLRHYLAGAQWAMGDLKAEVSN